MEFKYHNVANTEELTQAIARVREAQKQFAAYSQEQVDAIFLAAATAANRARIPLARMAVEETGMGVAEDKVIKNHYAAEYIYNAYKDTKTCGVIEEDAAFGIKKIAEPIGVIAAVIPTTNPTSTAIFKTLLALKTRNGMIISPHPRAKKCTIQAAKIVLEAAVEAGAPEGIIGWIDAPSLELSNLVMRECDLTLATGGPGMVKAAYSSGKPAIGVGPGNTPAVIDDSADLKLAARRIVFGKFLNCGQTCVAPDYILCDSAVKNQLVGYLKEEVLRQYGADVSYRTISKETSPETVTVTLENTLGVTEACEITENGVSIRVHGGTGTAYEIPVFAFDGAESTEIALSANHRELTVTHRVFRCRYATDGTFADTGETFRNRNGEYRHYRAVGTDNAVWVSVVLESL